MTQDRLVELAIVLSKNVLRIETSFANDKIKVANGKRPHYKTDKQVNKATKNLAIYKDLLSLVNDKLLKLKEKTYEK